MINIQYMIGSCTSIHNNIVYCQLESFLLRFPACMEINKCHNWCFANSRATTDQTESIYTARYVEDFLLTFNWVPVKEYAIATLALVL